MAQHSIKAARALASARTGALRACPAEALGGQSTLRTLERGFKHIGSRIAHKLWENALDALLDAPRRLSEETKNHGGARAGFALFGALERAVTCGAIDRCALDIARRAPATLTDLARIEGAAFASLGTDVATALWHPLAKTARVPHGLDDFQGGDPARAMATLLRAGLAGGRIRDPATGAAEFERTRRFLDLALRAMTAAHGLLDANNLLALARRPAPQSLSDAAFHAGAARAPGLGDKDTDASRSAWRRLMPRGLMSRGLTPAMSAGAADALRKLALLQPGDRRQQGGRAGAGADASPGLPPRRSNDPLAFARNLRGAMAAPGETDRARQRRAFGQMMSGERAPRVPAEQAARAAALMAPGWPAMPGERDALRAIGHKGSGANAPGANAPSANMAADSLATAAGGPRGENIIRSLHGLGDVINDVTRAARGGNAGAGNRPGDATDTLRDVLQGAAFAAPPGLRMRGLEGGAPGALAGGGTGALADIARDLSKHTGGPHASYSLLPAAAMRPAGAAPWPLGQSRQGGEPEPGLLNWSPPQRSPQRQPAVRTVKLGIDGRTLSEAVSAKLADLLEHPTSAPYWNGNRRYEAPDYQAVAT